MGDERVKKKEERSKEERGQGRVTRGERRKKKRRNGPWVVDERGKKKEYR